MAVSEDLIDFEVIENQKENIQSIPGGRSAKQLVQLLSPVNSTGNEPGNEPTLNQSAELKATIRADFEKELQSIDDADDPLDVFDRYIKWTLSAYPSAQATPTSGLLPLVERATKYFLANSLYKNDPRYLKIWLLYIKLFSDSPRETYAFLAKHGVGENLALYYEEYAAWLEQQGRWTQAEEVFGSGVDKEARPKERLLRKYAEFQQRREAKAQGDGPSSPALPRVRPALAKKSDLLEAAEDQDPQAGDRVATQTAASRTARSGRSKMAVFVDDEGASPQQTNTPGAPGWESIGSIADRKKENTHDPKPWAGEKLDGGKKSGGPKMMVFKDSSLGIHRNEIMSQTNSKPGLERVTVDAKGRRQYVFADLESIYPNGAGGMEEEFCFEELRAMRRGLYKKTWNPQLEVSGATKERSDSDATCNLNFVKPEVIQSTVQPLIDLSDENKPRIFAPTTVPLKLGSPAPTSKKSRKDDKANRTRKIKVVQMEVKAETQTIQLNLNSPSGPSRVRKKKPEATMTICTKEAMNEVYDIFNQPLNPEGAAKESEPEETDDFTEDDYTSAGESTGTGAISVGASEYGDDTMDDFTTSSRIETDAESGTEQMTTGSEFSEFSNTNTTGLEEDVEDDDDEDLSVVIVPGQAVVSEQSTTQDLSCNPEMEDGVTPTSPTGGNTLDYFEEHNQMDSSHSMGRMPYRVGKASGRLPFMTPIVEKTESSLGAITAGPEKSYASMKTPSRQNHIGTIFDIEDDDSGLLSSPFQESFEDKENNGGKIPQPALTKLATRPKAPLEESKSHIVNGTKELAKDSIRKGPIVLDSQCNPLDETIRKTILSQIHPPLETYTGYFSHSGQSANQHAEIKRYTKSSAKRETTSPPPVLTLSGSKRTYTVRRELGRGAFAPVYLADSTPQDDEEQPHDFGVQRQSQEVIKMEDPPTPWEFYILRQAKRRLGVSRPADSIVDTHEMHMFDDEGYLIEAFRSQGTLLDAVNAARADAPGGAMDEQLAMFFAVEIFRTVEAVHAKGLIHGDLKPDNIMLRFDGVCDAPSWSAQYARDGANGWADKGVMLIDFGRGIDMRVFNPDVQFIADWKTSEADCAEMREMRPWTFQVDYHGLAGILHSLLFGKYMETVAERGASLGAGATKTYRIREGLKRYWQTELWNECFEVLLNPLMHLDGEEGRKLPIVNNLKQLREKMEGYLEANCEKGVGLKALVRRLEASLKERRK